MKTHLIQWIHDRGWSDFAVILLEIIEPLAPLGAGALWIVQPVLGVFIARDTIADMAQLLDSPTELAGLRESLLRGENDGK
jgi:hypothetical protein